MIIDHFVTLPTKIIGGEKEDTTLSECICTGSSALPNFINIADHLTFHIGYFPTKRTHCTLHSVHMIQLTRSIVLLDNIHFGGRPQFRGNDVICRAIMPSLNFYPQGVWCVVCTLRIWCAFILGNGQSLCCVVIRWMRLVERYAMRHIYTENTYVFDSKHC